MTDTSSTRSSRSMPHPAGRRPLDARWLAAILLAVLAVSEATAAWVEERTSTLADRLRNSALDAERGGRRVVVLGGCLPGQFLVRELFEHAMGQGVRMENLSAPGSFTLSWYLLVDRYVRTSKDAGVVLVPYSEGDLARIGLLWDSDVMWLSRWSTLPFIVHAGCESWDCAIDIVLRKAFAFYRLREQAANRAWRAFGKRDATMEEDSSGPGRGSGVAGQLGWRRPENWDEHQREAVTLVQSMILLARSRGAQVLFVPIPRNPDAPPVSLSVEEQVTVREVKRMIPRAGGRLVGPLRIEGLSPADLSTRCT